MAEETKAKKPAAAKKATAAKPAAKKAAAKPAAKKATAAKPAAKKAAAKPAAKKAAAKACREEGCCEACTAKKATAAKPAAKKAAAKACGEESDCGKACGEEGCCEACREESDRCEAGGEESDGCETRGEEGSGETGGEEGGCAEESPCKTCPGACGDPIDCSDSWPQVRAESRCGLAVPDRFASRLIDSPVMMGGMASPLFLLEKLLDALDAHGKPCGARRVSETHVTLGRVLAKIHSRRCGDAGLGEEPHCQAVTVRFELANARIDVERPGGALQRSRNLAACRT
jgi:hypothetical protein